MSAFANDIVLFAFSAGAVAGAIVATIGWGVWMWRAMNPRREDQP